MWQGASGHPGAPGSAFLLKNWGRIGKALDTWAFPALRICGHLTSPLFGLPLGAVL